MQSFPLLRLTPLKSLSRDFRPPGIEVFLVKQFHLSTVFGNEVFIHFYQPEMTVVVGNFRAARCAAENKSSWIILNWTHL